MLCYVISGVNLVQRKNVKILEMKQDGFDTTEAAFQTDVTGNQQDQVIISCFIKNSNPAIHPSHNTTLMD